MNLLITGGAGFIGSNFIRYMTDKYPHYKIVNLDKLTYAGNIENLKDIEGSSNYVFVKGDICEKTIVDEVFQKYDINGVVHLAAESHVDRSILAPEGFLKTNVLGTYTLLEAARNFWSGKSIGRFFLNVSTDEVYGSIEKGSFTEDSPYAPNSPYSASKAGADCLVRAYNKTYGLPTLTTHCANNYGHYQFPEKFIPLMLLNAIEGKTLPVYGDGLNVRDWTHVLDHLCALDLILHKGKPGSVYNIGGHNEWKNLDLVRLLCSILDELMPDSPYLPHSNLIRFVKDRPGHDRRYSIDSSKLKKELTWKPTVKFENGLKDTVKWYIANLDWVQRVRTGEYMEYYEKNYLSR